jgi:serine/threonine protein kinase
MAVQPVVHPAAETLLALGMGKLDDATAQRVFAHLEQCSDCRQQVAGQTSDEFLQRMRAALSHSAPTTRATEETSPPLPPPLHPELPHIPGYEVLRELGRGGMGVVYLAENQLLKRREVLKVVSKHLLDQPGAVERFLREIQAVAQLHHPNLVTAYSALQVGDLLLFAMEHVEGENLAKIVEATGPVAVADACSYAQQVALGLQHAHERNLIHRDIKPQNLMLTREDARPVVKILDFGLAKATREKEALNANLTGPDMMMGSPGYIAPEQVRDAARADIRADIYSLGCTLYFLLTGRPPFVGRNLYEVLQAHVSKESTPLNEVRAEVPAGLAAVVAKMMVKEPAQRYQTPLEAARALAPFCRSALKHSPATVVPSPGGARREPRTTRMTRAARDWRVLSGIAVALGMLVVGVAVWLAPMILRVKTPQGTIELVVTEPDAEVLVDGNKIDVRVPGDLQPLHLEVEPGRPHELKVTKGAFQAFTKEVTVLAGKKEEIRAKLVPEKVEPVREPEDPEKGFTPLSGGKEWERWYVQRQINGVGTWDFGNVELHATYHSRWANDEPILATKRDDFRDFQLQFDVKLGSSEAFFCFRDQPPRFTGAPNYPVYKGKGYGVLLADARRVKPELAQQVSGSLLMTGMVYENELLSAASEDRWRKGDWNTMGVTVRGNVITVAVNGTKVVQFVDPEARLRRGHFSFSPTVGCDLYVRNIRLKELPPTPIAPISRPPLWTVDRSFVPLFNRKDLTGWKVYPEGAGGWKVEAGLLTGRGPQSHLFSERGDYENFHLRAECRINFGGDSGLFFRSLFGPGFPVGYEAQILPTRPVGHLATGTLFEFGNGGKEIAHFETANNQLMAPDTWFTQEVIADGDHVVILVNGKKAVDEKLPSGYRRKGHLALQQFSLGTVVEFCRIEIEELPPSNSGDAK